MFADLINFDTRTLIGVLVWGNAAAGIIVYLYHAFNVRNADGNNIRNMTIIRLLCAVGYLLLFFRGNLPDILSVNTGNTVLFLSHYMEARLMLELANVSNKKLNNIITVIFSISVLAFNTIEFICKDAPLRVSVASIIIFSIFILPTIRIMTSKAVSKYKRSISIFYVFLLCALIPRSIQPFMDKSVTVLSNNYYQTLMFIALILMTVSNTIIYLLFMKERTDKIIEKSSVLETLLNALDTYMFVAELDTDRVIFINDRMKERFNLGEDSIGKLCYEVMNPCMNEKCDFCVKCDLLKNPDLVESMDTLIEINGANYRKADRIIEWHNGEKVHLQYFIDVSELKQLELELVKAKEKAECIIDTAPVAYSLSVDGVILEVNEYAEKHLGLKPGGKTTSVYVHPEERDRIFANADNPTVNGVASLYINDGGSHRFLISYGTLKHGDRDAYILWAVDIEENELQKDHLQQTRQSLQTVLDFLPVPITIVDVNEGHLIYTNKSAAKLFGVTSPEDVYGCHVTEFLPELQPDGADSFEKTLMLDSETPSSVELTCLKPDGESFEALVTACIIDYKGKQASISIIQDLTADKEYQSMLRNTAEKEREANRSKSMFLSRMSHEIRTPMNAIIGMTSIAQNSDDIEKAKQCLTKIENASKHLLGVINDILDMSKIEADKFELSYDEFDFYKVFDDLVDMIRFRTEGKQQAVNVKIDDNVPQYIIGDEQRLSQVITNLLSNATKFTPEQGTIGLNVKIVDERDSLFTLQIEVEDNGIGIPLEQQTNIFNSFEQAGVSIARRYGGTGLGLAISKRIVELMGGSIWVESELGNGSKFAFTIKVMRGNGQLIDTNLSHALFSHNDFSSHTILLAEDVEINSEIIRAVLEDTGVEIDAVPNGLEAVRHFQNNPDRYSLILMDINMPEMDGYDATQSIRSLDYEKAKTVPIIAMTADVFKEDVEHCIAAGMNDHIGKPLDMDELFIKLNKYLLQ